MSKTIKLIFLLCALGGLFITVDPLTAQDTARESFISGNAAYSQAKYDQAIADYEKSAGQGFVGGNLFYNLGNAYFKKGELGKAVLNYERARIYIPSDSDLRANYEYARSQLNLPESTGPNWFLRALDRILGSFNADGLACGLVILAGLFFALLIAAMFFRPLRNPAKAFGVALAVLAVAFSLELSGKADLAGKGAVVIAQNAQARFEPLESATVYFDVPEGSLVEILEKHGNWYKIKRPDNKIGWVDSSLLETIESI